MSLEGRRRRGVVLSSDVLFPCFVPVPSAHLSIPLLHPCPFPLSILPRLLLLCVHFISPFFTYVRILYQVIICTGTPSFSSLSSLFFFDLTCPDTTYHGLIFSTLLKVSLAYIRIPSLDPSLFSSPSNLSQLSLVVGIVQSNSPWDLFSFLLSPLSSFVISYFLLSSVCFCVSDHLIPRLSSTYPFILIPLFLHYSVSETHLHHSYRRDSLSFQFPIHWHACCMYDVLTTDS